MDNRFFDNPVLDSPCAYPIRHRELDRDGQPTQRIVESRRRADFISPVPNPRKRGGSASQERLREAGCLTGDEIAAELGVAIATVKERRSNGWLQATAHDHKPRYPYPPLGSDLPNEYRLNSILYRDSTPHVA